jgi:hypothetical protein
MAEATQSVRLTRAQDQVKGTSKWLPSKRL